MNPDPRQPQEQPQEEPQVQPQAPAEYQTHTPQQPQAPVAPVAPVESSAPIFTDVPEPVVGSFAEPLETPAANQFGNTPVTPDPAMPSPFGASADSLAPTPLVQPTPIAGPSLSGAPLVAPTRQSNNKLIIILAIVGGVLVLGGAVVAVLLTL